MQFSSKEDIEAPVAAVFRALSDFETFERSAIRRGADVERVTDLSPPREGMSWRVAFALRGKMRQLDVTLAEYEEPSTMRLDGVGKSTEGYLSIELVPLSANRTRLGVVLNVKPKSLSGRLLLQSLKLAKTNLTKRFKLRVAEFAKGIEDQAASAV